LHGFFLGGRRESRTLLSEGWSHGKLRHAFGGVFSVDDDDHTLSQFVHSPLWLWLL